MSTQVESSHVEGSHSKQSKIQVGMLVLFKLMQLKYLHCIYYIVFLCKANIRGKTRGVKWKLKRDDKTEPVVVDIHECLLRVVGDNAQQFI